MRTYTGPQDTVLSGGSYRVSARALVANADGTMIDLTTAGGTSWFDKIDLDTTIDQAVSQATITLRRGAGPTLSLSPLRSDSTVNVNGVGAYAPLIDLGRKIEIDVATTAIGVAPVTADWQPMFLGYIDTIDFGTDPISITARDLGAALVDTWLEADATYGTGPGRALELVMQDILDAAFGVGVIPLYTPTTPAFLINTFTQKSMAVMAALTALVGTIGWDLRYAWDPGTSQFRLTLSQPPRTNTTPIYTFGPSRYIDVTKLAFDRTNIRNAIGVNYPVTDLVTGAEARAQIPTAVDTTSVAKYGRRYMGITEPSGSPINSQTKAQNLAAAALADLKSPPAEQEIELHFDWRVELHDLDTFSANAVHYNADQTWAVAGVRHTLTPTQHRTRITARGAPAGSYLSWIGRGPNGTPIGKPTAPIAKITPGTNAGSSQLDLTFDATPGVGGSTLLDFKIWIKRGGTTTIALDSVINVLTLPYLDTFTRDPQMVLVAMFVVTDRTTGLSGAPAFYAIESSRNYINSSGQPVRSQPWSDGGYGFKSTDASGFNMDVNALDSTARNVNKFFAKALSGNPDQFDSVPEGVTYNRTLASRVAGGRPLIDFSEGIHLNKGLANISDNAGRFAAASAGGMSDGFQILTNPDFTGGSIAGYSIYDNNSTGLVSLTGEADATAPNSSGYRMKIVVAAGAAPSPGLGGFFRAITVDAGPFAVNTYHQGSTIIWRIRANIPIGSSIQFNSNPFGTGGYVTWVTSAAGTGGWFEYVVIQVIGTGGTLSSTGFFSIDTGARPFTWYVAMCSAVCTSHPAGFGVPEVDANRRPLTDFSSAHYNKNTDNIGDGTGTPLSGGKRGQLGLDASGNAQPTMLDSGSRAINKFFAKPLSSSPDTADSIGDGTSTGITNKTDRTNLVASIDGTGVLGAKLIRSRGFSDGNTAAQTTDVSGFILHSSAVDSSSRSVNAMFYKPTDTTDAITDGTGTPLSGGKRGQIALNSSNRIADQTHLPMVRTASGGATPYNGGTTNLITTVWNAGPASYTSTAASSTLKAGSVAVTYSTGSVAGLGQNLTYYIYTDDTNYAGGSPTYSAATPIYTPTGADGRNYIGAVVTGSGGSSSQSYAGGSAACFVADTKIAMADGTEKRIADIEVDDMVLSFDPAQGILRPKRVTSLKVHDVDSVVEITTKERGVTTTPEHPFYNVAGGFTQAGFLTERDRVMSLSGDTMVAEQIESIVYEGRPAKVTVYNFEVEGWHTYFANGLAVHNVKLL